MIERITMPVCSPDLKHRTPDGLAWPIGMWMKLGRTLHSLLGNSHQICILKWFGGVSRPFASHLLVTGSLGDTTILPKPQAFQYPTMKYCPILHSAWISGHWGWSIWICQALKWAKHCQGQGNEESKEQNAIQVEDLWMSTQCFKFQGHLVFPKFKMSQVLGRHLEKTGKVCILPVESNPGIPEIPG